jgi:hypothetical protein
VKKSRGRAAEKGERGWVLLPEKEEWAEEEREEKCFSIKIMYWVCTVFPYALGNTVETQWTKLNVGLLLWEVFVVFSLFFPK